MWCCVRVSELLILTGHTRHLHEHNDSAIADT